MEYDEINLQPYVAAVARRWSWILIGAIVAAAVAVGVSFSLPKKYQATANVLVTIHESNIGFGGEGPLSNIETIDAEARRQGMVVLAQSDAIEARLPQKFIATIDLPGYRPGMLLDDKRVTAYANGDLIGFMATGPRAEEAQQLANAWADTFTKYAQQLYNDDLTRITVASEALVPLKPAGPNIVGNGLLAFVLGGLLGLGLALLAAVVKLPRPSGVRVAGKVSSGQPSPTR